MNGLREKVAFVAGGSLGIGKACSLALAKEGTKVAVIGARNPEAGEETRKKSKELAERPSLFKPTSPKGLK